MQAALKLRTTVLPGGRIELTAPELLAGEDVELLVFRPTAIPARQESHGNDPQGVWDYIQSLPPVERTPEEWAAVEREFQEERDSWDR